MRALAVLIFFAFPLSASATVYQWKLGDTTAIEWISVDRAFPSFLTTADPTKENLLTIDGNHIHLEWHFKSSKDLQTPNTGPTTQDFVGYDAVLFVDEFANASEFPLGPKDLEVRPDGTVDVFWNDYILDPSTWELRFQDPLQTTYRIHHFGLDQSFRILHPFNDPRSPDLYFELVAYAATTGFTETYEMSFVGPYVEFLGAAPTAVPEPASVLLLSCGALFALRKRRRRSENL